MLQGANDPRVLKVESDEIVAALRKNDVAVEYVLFEDEGHGFRGRDNRSEDEKIGLMIPDKTGTRLMTGTSRMSDDIRRALAGRKPAWLEIFTTFPPVSAWELPEPLE